MPKIKLKNCVALLVSLIMGISLCACGGKPGGSGSESKSPSGTSDGDSGDSSADIPSSAEPKFSDNVYTVDLCDEVTREYLNAVDVGEEYDVMRRYAGTMHDSQKTASITLTKGKAPYEVRISDNKDMKDASALMTATKSFVFGGTAIPGVTYYYEAADCSGKTVERGTIETIDAPVRIINAAGGRNIRDAGGWVTESGLRVKYGLLYRGAQLNGYKGGAKLGEAGIKVFRDELGIKTELDLRGTSDNAGQTECVFGTDRNYRMISVSQYDMALAGSKTQLKEIFELLADESNYPVYFHCNAGADRTGTLAFLVNGLLGVSESDLTKDFELTSFCGQGKRLRSADTGNGYDDSGVFQNDSSNYVAWGKTVEYIRKNYVKGDVTTLSGGIEKYLLGIGVSQNDLNKIKVLMLGLSEKAGGHNVEPTCENKGTRTYELNGKEFIVETPATGHDFAIDCDKAKCRRCGLSGEYVHVNADTSSATDFGKELSLGGATVSDNYGKNAGAVISFAKNDASDSERFFIVKSGDKTVIAGVTVWSKIIRTEEDLKNANAVTVADAATKTIKGYFLFENDITLGKKQKQTDAIGYNEYGYTFSGVIDGNGKVLDGLKTENNAGLVYAFSGEIRNLTVKGEATEDGAQFLCVSAYGGKISNVKIEVLLGEKSIDVANSALLGNIGENGSISDIYLENVVIIESSATEKKANRKKSSALGKMFNEADKQKIFIDGLTIVGIRPIITAAFDDFDVAGEVTLKSFLGDNVKNVKIYNTVFSYEKV